MDRIERVRAQDPVAFARAVERVFGAPDYSEHPELRELRMFFDPVQRLDGESGSPLMRPETAARVEKREERIANAIAGNDTRRLQQDVEMLRHQVAKLTPATPAPQPLPNRVLCGTAGEPKYIPPAEYGYAGELVVPRAAIADAVTRASACARAYLAHATPPAKHFTVRDGWPMYLVPNHAAVLA